MKSQKSFWIEFIGDRSVKIEEGQTILEASLQAGIPHYHACGGKGKCSTCRVLVKDGETFLTPPGTTELRLHKQISFPPNVRLACQTFVRDSSVRLHRIIRDEADIAMYIQDDADNAFHSLGEEKELVLFFLDIRNFTPFMQAYPAFDVIHIVRRLFALFRKVIEAYKGKIIETAGDGLYAVFGLEEKLNRAAQNAIDAGLNILQELQELNNSYFSNFFNHHFEIGIGAHAGRTIVGSIGLGINNNPTVMGLAVNIASRLQSATREVNNSFLISEDVARLLPEIPSSSGTEIIRLKGVRNKIKVHFLGAPFERNHSWSI
jgi:adenylate cyclase